MSCFCCC